MYPSDMFFDDYAIGFIDISNDDLTLNEIKFNNLDLICEKKILKNAFYEMSSTSDYILKINKNKSVNDVSLRQMIEKLCKMQYLIDNIDFPIGYVKNKNNIVGQIIRYYANSKSFKIVNLTESLEDLQKYIYLDDDSLHNLFLIFLNILEKIESLFENGISYLDIHSGNIVFYKNEIKLIDFEPCYISFSKIRYYQQQVIYNYTRLVNTILNNFFIEENLQIISSMNSFKDIKHKVKCLENNVRNSIL